MATVQVERRLAAILAADIVGYSRLIEADEVGTLAELRKLRAEIIDPILSKHRGRIVKLMGDGIIVEFGSVVDAVSSAIALQDAISKAQTVLLPKRQIIFRIGINLGDVVVVGEDLLGDGVNVAARLESLAQPGGILISHTVHDHLHGKLDCYFEDLGEQSVKNITRPIRVYRVGWREDVPALPTPPRAQHTLADRTSLAVLPFTNMSDDQEQDYFAEGLAEDLITDLSRVPGFFIIARNSTLAYKKASDLRKIARELGVRYVIQGSVRRAASRIRINVQLIEAVNHRHIWAERFDRDIADVFTLQDDVVGKIVRALAEVLPSSGVFNRRRASSLEAYELFARGRTLACESAEANKTARTLLSKAIAIDPEFADAHGWLAICHRLAWTNWGEGIEHRSLAVAAAKRAVALNSDDAGAHMVLGYVSLYEAEWEEAVTEYDLALRLNPNHADSWASLADLRVLEGNAAEAINCVRYALQLNPFPPGWYYWNLGFSQYAAGQYGEAEETLKRVETYPSLSRRILAATLAKLGRADEARYEAGQFLKMTPHFSVKAWSSTQPFRDERTRAHFVDGYLMAGLPP